MKLKKIKMNKQYAALAALLLVGALLGYGSSKIDLADISNVLKRKPTRELPYKYDANISENAQNLFGDENALFSYVKKFGPKKTTQYLATFPSCHDTAHKAGRMAYELAGADAFKQCSSECHSGCYHGATEAYFKEHGTENLSENIATLCSSELNAFFTHQCFHGIGHGLTAWTNYDVPKALTDCDLLPNSSAQSSCWTGVFMENIVGGLASKEGHVSKYLSSDPLYPCTDPKVEEKYRVSCYFLQTSRMMQLFASDFKKIGDACAKAPKEYQRSCFESMGRDVGGVHRADSTMAIKMCSYAPKGSARVGCLVGAVQDTFWDPSGQDIALGFCKKLTDKEEKDACYGTIFGRAPEVILAREAHEAFCAKAEEAYKGQCRSYIR